MLHWLLLEGDHDLGQAIAEHLRTAGHRVQWCLRIADAGAAPAPALALLDLHLPDGDGLDLLHAWRAAGGQRPRTEPGRHWRTAMVSAPACAGMLIHLRDRPNLAQRAPEI